MLEYFLVSSISEKFIGLAALGVAGFILVGCDNQKSPGFPNCSFDDGDKTDTFYLRRNAAGTSLNLRIGDTLFKREGKNGPLKMDGQILEPNSEVILKNLPDGRDYDVGFTEHKFYTRADVFSRCESRGGIPEPVHPQDFPHE